MAKKNIEGLAIPYGLKSPNKMANADGYYGTYDSLQDALDTVVLAIREPGRTVGIKENDKVVEYWWESTTDLSDEALVKKTSEGEFIKNGEGWSLKYRKENPDFYGPIGKYALDLSYASSVSTESNGALGQYSVVLGYGNSAKGLASFVAGASNYSQGQTNHIISFRGAITEDRGTANKGKVNNALVGGEANGVQNSISSVILGGTFNTIKGEANPRASNYNSFNAIIGGNGNSVITAVGTTRQGFSSVILAGENNTAQGHYNVVGGYRNHAVTIGETIFGILGTTQNLTLSGYNYLESSRIFNIGIGQERTDGTLNRQDGLSVYRNGKVYAPSLSISSIDNEADTSRILVTKEWVEGKIPGSFTKTENGLVPAPNTTTSTKFLREDGTWVIPTNTTYTAGTSAVLNTGTSATNQIWSAKVLTENFIPLNGTKDGKSATGTVKYTDILSFDSEGTNTHIGLGQDFIEMSAIGEGSSITQTINGLGSDLTYETPISSYSRNLEQEMTTEEFYSNTYSQTSSILNSGVSLSFRHFNNTTNVTKDLSVSNEGIQATEGLLPFMGKKPNDVVTVQNLSNYPLSTNWSNPSQRMSALPDKSADATYHNILGVDDLGNIAKVGTNAIVENLQNMNSLQINTLVNTLSGGFVTSKVSIVGVYPPIINNALGVDSIYLIGTGLNLPTDEIITKVEIIHLQTGAVNQVSYKIINATKMQLFINPFAYPNGEYKVRVTVGFRSFISTLNFKIDDSININELQTSGEDRWSIIANPDLNQSTYTFDKTLKTMNFTQVPITGSDKYKAIIVFEHIFNGLKDFMFEGTYSTNLTNGRENASATSASRVGFINNDIFENGADTLNILKTTSHNNSVFNTIGITRLQTTANTASSVFISKTIYLNGVGFTNNLANEQDINFVIIKEGDYAHIILNGWYTKQEINTSKDRRFVIFVPDPKGAGGTSSNISHQHKIKVERLIEW